MCRCGVALSWSLKDNSTDFKIWCTLKCAMFPEDYNTWRNQLAVFLKPPATDHHHQNAIRQHYLPFVARHTDEKVSNVLPYRMDIIHREL